MARIQVKKMIVAIGLTGMGMGMASADQVNSLYTYKSKSGDAQSALTGVQETTRHDTVPSGFQGRINNGGGKGAKNVLKSSWITVSEPAPRELKVHDLITIVVNEVSKNSTKADTKSDRELDVQGKISDWVRMNDHTLRPDKQKGGDPTVGMNYNRNFEGKNDIKREDMLATRIQAEIIDIMPNGNLYLEASRKIVTDEEETEITLTGQCRNQDVGMDNTIISTKVANLNVIKRHKGIAHDTNKRGWLVKILEAISPF